MIRCARGPGASRRAVAVLIAVAALAAFVSLASAPAAAAPADTAAVDTAARAAETPPAPEHPRVRFVVEKRGEIEIELYPDQAPKGAERVLALVRAGFYDGLKFHRVESYLIQTGQRESDLPPVEGEMFGQKLTHEEGSVGMARLLQNYDSATTQIYICKKHLPLMNGEFTIVGRVTSGLDVVSTVKKGDRIVSARIVE